MRVKYERKKRKARSNWSKRFAWFPVLARQEDDNDKRYCIWLECYMRYFNYGAPVKYIIKGNAS